MKVTDKSDHMMTFVDLEHPALAAVAQDAQPTAALLGYLAESRRRFRFEYDRKREILAFLDHHYDGWRPLNKTAAEKFVEMSPASARGPRALAGIAALGRAWWATDDPAYGAAFQRFYAESATGEMANWGSFSAAQVDLELDAWYLLLDCPGFTQSGRIAFLDHLFTLAAASWDDHTRTWRQTTLGPEGHNWYIHGMQGLPYMGLLFPELQLAGFWLRTGWSVFEEHLRGHYQADGGARETTLGYQSGTMLCLWDLYQAGRRHGHPMSPGVAERLLQATRFLLELQSPLGGLPSFGDGGHSPGGLGHLAATAAAVSGDRTCKWYAEYARQFDPSMSGPAGVIPQPVFWRVGLEGAATYAATRPRQPHTASVLQGATGYAVLRRELSTTAGYLAIACADRGPIVTSHGHNDILAIEVHADGVRYLGEMGCAPYGNSKGRDYDQTTRAHNTIQVDDLEQVPICSEWRWQHHLRPAVRRWLDEPTHTFFHGVHEGFYRYGQCHVLHARKVLHLRPPSGPAYWLVFDWLETPEVHTYHTWFHGCVPGRRRGRNIELRDGSKRLLIIPPQRERLTLQKLAAGDDKGRDAYLAERRLTAHDCPAFVYRKTGPGDCLVWAIVPLTDDQEAPIVRRLPCELNGARVSAQDAAAVSVEFAQCTDTVCVSHLDFDATLCFGEQTVFGHLCGRRIDSEGGEQFSFLHTMPDGSCGR